MSEPYLGSPPSGHAKGDAAVVETNGSSLAASRSHDPATPQNTIDLNDAEAGRALAQMARDQLARDIADIEQAADALRRAPPALEAWTKPLSPMLTTHRPLWLLIGVLWLSTALVTAGAVAAIAVFAG